ncbi:ATP-dependent DEAD/H RNA helicase [Novymonas esmeraldas]|uniref:ATP-dependent RNA helicase n=1 Tax=Novymonas esmeraldas TaxID=1808958 RepID=A0AAW0F1K6_9TRYP
MRRVVLRGHRSAPWVLSIRGQRQHGTWGTGSPSVSAPAGPSPAPTPAAVRRPGEADLLFDVLGDPTAPPGSVARHHRASPSTTGAEAEAQRGDAAAPEWSQHIQQVVRQAVLHPLHGALSSSSSKGDGSGPRTLKDGDDTAPSSLTDTLSAQYKVMVVDAMGMPADLPAGAPQSFEDLLQLSPEILRTQLAALMERKHYRVLTPVQAASIPLMLEYRDLLCIAPTATGKTLCYVYASMLRLLMHDMRGGQAGSGDGGGAAPGSEGGGGGENMTRRHVETFLQEKINKGEVCPYCELSTSEVRVCPLTGLPHPSAVELATELALRSSERRAARLEELQSSVAEPRVLVLVPTSQLAHQVYASFRYLHCDYRIRSMVRANSAQEQRKYLEALEGGVDVLIASPETILPALYKHKLSLRRVQTVVMDEVDDIVSVNHFEPTKIILGALPKGALRPQRLLFGATLPPVAYEMLKTRMLLPSHRFVLVDLKAPAERRRGAAAQLSSPDTLAATSVAGDGILTARANLRHVVFMVGRAEKAQKLAWLYETGKLNPDQRTLIFCNSRHNVAYVRDRLKELVPQVHATTLSSHASSSARDGVLKMFRTGVSTCLICTDLLSRGIDFQGVVYVVHYDMPADMETWTHRCGRGGRGGLLQGTGYVYTFFQPENVKLAKPLVGYLRQQQQLVPPKLREYAKHSFIDVFNNSLFHHPTRPYRKSDPQHSTPVLGRGARRFPDYKLGTIHRHFRPQ